MWECLKLGLIKVNAKCRCGADASKSNGMQHSVADSWTVCVCVCTCTLNTRMALTHSLGKALVRLDSFATRRNLHARHPFVVQDQGAGKREGWGGQAMERERESAAQWALGPMGWLCGLSSLASVLAHYECRWIKRREIEFFGACWSRNWNWNCLMPQQFSYSFTFPHSLFTIYPSRDPFLCAGVFQLSGFPVAVE